MNPFDENDHNRFSGDSRRDADLPDESIPDTSVDLNTIFPETVRESPFGGSQPQNIFEDIDRAPPFSVGNAFATGWGGFTSRYGLLLGATVLYFVIFFAAEILLAASSLITLLPIGSWTANIFFYPVLLIGVMQIALHTVRGRPAGIGDLFSGFRRYLPIVGSNVLVFVAVYAVLFVAGLLIALVFFAFRQSITTQGTAGIALIVIFSMLMVLVPLLLFYPRILFVPMICMDTEVRTIGVLEAFKTSWRMTAPRGTRGRIIGVAVLLVLLNMLSFLMLVLPFLLFSAPLSFAVYGAVYWQISRNYWKSQRHTCMSCGYDLLATPGDRCPECGTPISSTQRDILTRINEGRLATP